MKGESSTNRRTRKSIKRVVGLMSGTSGDGIDVAIVDMGSRSIRVRGYETLDYSESLRAQLLALVAGDTVRLDELCHLNFVLAHVFADAIIQVCRKFKIALPSIDLIGSHGHTVCHRPKGRRFGKQTVRSTLQIGEPAIIAQRTGIRTVSDFRPADMAVGGQGAPLVPFADLLMFQSAKSNRAIQNIGGIANVTWLGRKDCSDQVMAFDTGPGNMVIDRFAQLLTGGKKRYDRDGRMAREGRVHRGLLAEMLKHSFLRRRPPKSTGREEFGCHYSDKQFRQARKSRIAPADLMATVTSFTARTIGQAYRRFLPQLPDEMVLCGGGAHNKTLVGMLSAELADVRLVFSDDLGVPCDAREAAAFAVLACAAAKGRCNNVPAATGASRAVIMGKIVPAG